MIVYRDQRFRADPRRLLTKLCRAATRFGSGSPASHDSAVEALVDAGMLEAGLLDATFPDVDGVHPLAEELRRASSAVGHILWHTWHQRPGNAGPWWSELSASLNAVWRRDLPPTIELTVPEGYAYYAVYPETYIEAAKQCHAELGDLDVVCLGLRSIGASLSAVVVGALEELGCGVKSFIIRPRGHPFSRVPILSAELEREFRCRPSACFLVVDEGPGISGSSLGGTAAMLRSLGIGDDRIILFPSWSTDGSQLRSSVAREHWARHRQFSVTFEDSWLRSGRLSSALPGHLRDLSAGAWRQELYGDPARYPAVQPQHERRKYLLEPDGAPGLQQSKLLSFVGLGDHPAPKLRRAERLAAAGFTPEPEMLVHGFMVRSFVPGTPVSPEPTDSAFLETVAAYLAHLCREHGAEPSTSQEALREMITANVAEGLGDIWLPPLESRLPSHSWPERPVMLDGRMLPHEWIQTGCGYLKTDAIDHHDDHFFPGCQDIAWDVAAACLELNLSTGARQHLVERYRSLSQDRTIASRLPIYATGYLAFRLGYATLAASVLGKTPDGRRFAAAAQRYSSLLRRELTDLSEDHWDV